MPACRWRLILQCCCLHPGAPAALQLLARRTAPAALCAVIQANQVLLHSPALLGVSGRGDIGCLAEQRQCCCHALFAASRVGARARARAALLQGPAIQALALAPAAAPKALAGRLLALLRRPAPPAAPGGLGAGPEAPAGAPSAGARPAAPPALPPAGEAALAHAAQALLAELWPGGGYAALEAPDAAAASAPLSAVGGPAGAAAAAVGPALRWLAALRGAVAAAAAQRRTGLTAGGGAPAAPSDGAPPRLGDAPAMVLAGLLGHADARVAAAAAGAAAVAAAAAPLAGIGLLPVLLCQLQARLAGGPAGAARPRTRLWRPAVTWGHAAL